MERGIMGQIQSIIHPSPPRPMKKPNYDIIVKRSKNIRQTNSPTQTKRETRNLGKRDDQQTNSDMDET